MIQLNPHVFSEAKASLGETGFCRVGNALPEDQAALLGEDLKKTLYKLAFTLNGKPVERTAEEMRQMSQSERNALFADIIMIA